ncbi:ABC transporter permease [Mycoplasma putrefaciens]|uniref:ABC transporter permease n=1 Tax=Mycoplasma putrefaciens TaxID=2123 RepID=UPI003DA27A09
MQSKICWTLSRKAKYWFSSDAAKTKRKYIKGSLFSILAGFIVSGIFLSFLNINPFQYFALLFGINFDSNFYEISLNWMAVYIVAGLSMAIAFKSGVFNIGASGQILTATSVATIILFYGKENQQVTSVDGSMIVLMFLACVVSAAFLAFIAGLLKALFNIHEVVSTILLNWSVFYIFKWFFGHFKEFAGGLSFTSKNIPAEQLNIGSNTVVIPLLIALVCVVVVWILFSKTTLGFKLKAVGSSPTASKYVGINVKAQIINSLTLSGALAGIAGFISMFTVSPNNFFATNSLPTLGFDAIAVSLVAFNNPIGIIGIGWLWAVIKTGGGPVSSLYNISTQISGLISGILIYFTAIASIFIMFKPWELLKNRFNLLTSGVNKEIVWKLKWHQFKLKLQKTFLIFTKQYKDQVNQTYQEYLTNQQVQKQLTKPHWFWSGRKNVKLDLKKELNHSIIMIDNKIDEIKTFVNEDKTRLNVNGLKTKLKEQLNLIDAKFIQQSRDYDLELTDYKYKVKQTKDKVLKEYSTAVKENKKFHKLRVQEIKMFRDTQIGIISYEFDYRDNVIEIKANKLKTIAILEEQIKNLKSEYKLQKEILKLDKTLASSEKTKKLAEVKQSTNQQISQLKQEITKTKQQASQEISEQKAKYQAQKTRVKDEQVQLQVILSQYLDDLEKEQYRFEQAKKAALANKQQRLEKIDIKRSQADVDKAKVLLNELSTLIDDHLDLNFNQQAIKNNQKTLKKALELQAKINELFGAEIIKDYDALEFINQKTKISLKAFKLITFLEKQNIYVITRFEEQELINHYQNWINQAQQILDDSKQQYQTTVDQAPRKTLSELEKLFNLEKSLKQQTNLNILKLENTMLKEVK